ncbi:MAG: HAD family hydrolase [Wenzhouxiangella sp.]
MTPGPASAVLFDLDGTLVDSAPDLLGALDQVLAERGLPASDHERLRHHASRGAAGILEAGLGASVDDRTRRAFLDHYGRNLWCRTRPFEGIEAMLEALAGRGIPMGVVTNKISRFADPVIAHAGWTEYFGCVIAGDRVDRPKPDPEGVLEACRQLGVTPGRCLFVGDDRRDVIAGRAAGVVTLIAGWGYLPPGEDVTEWRADRFVREPREVVKLAESS